jgi:hypothetical protein
MNTVICKCRQSSKNFKHMTQKDFLDSLILDCCEETSVTEVTAEAKPSVALEKLQEPEIVNKKSKYKRKSKNG